MNPFKQMEKSKSNNGKHGQPITYKSSSMSMNTKNGNSGTGVGTGSKASHHKSQSNGPNVLTQIQKVNGQPTGMNIQVQIEQNQQNI